MRVAFVMVAALLLAACGRGADRPVLVEVTPQAAPAPVLSEVAPAQ